MIRDKSNKGYHKLLVWKRAKEFVSLIYKTTSTFPKSEEFGIKNQARRAAVSVVLNIVEGYRRRSTKEFLRFLDISQASLAEIEACLEISLDLKYLTESEVDTVDEKRGELAFLINSLVVALNKKM